jgi:hypothetical protein
LKRIAQTSEVMNDSERQLQVANLDLFTRLRKIIKLPLHDGGDLEWEVLDISKALPAMLGKSGELRRWYASAVARYPPTASRQWSVAFAFDEFCPGNKLQAGIGIPRTCRGLAAVPPPN